VKLRVERSEARCGFELGLGLGVEAGLWDWLRWWRRRMGVSCCCCCYFGGLVREGEREVIRNVG
jgi:hypothetical protein